MTAVARIAADCPLCGRPLRRRRRKDGSGEFLGCSGWPRCEFIESIDLNVERLSRDLTAARADVQYLKDLQVWARSRLQDLASRVAHDVAVHIDEIARHL